MSYVSDVINDRGISKILPEKENGADLEPEIEIVDPATLKPDNVQQDAIKENETLESGWTEVSFVDWKTYEISLNEVVTKLPCTYSEFQELTGLSIPDNDSNLYIDGGECTIVELVSGDDSVLFAEITNTSEESKPCTDCLITKVCQSRYQVSKGENVVVFPGGLSVGKEVSESKLREVFGDPKDTYKYLDEDYESYTITYSEDDDLFYNYYEIILVDGVVEELCLDHR